MRGPPPLPNRWQGFPQQWPEEPNAAGACWGEADVGAVITAPAGPPETFGLIYTEVPHVLRGGEAHDFTIYAALAEGYEIASEYDVTLDVRTRIHSALLLPQPRLEVPVPVRGIALHVIADNIEVTLRAQGTEADVPAGEAYFWASCRYGRPQRFVERFSGLAPGVNGSDVERILIPWGATGARVFQDDGAGGPMAPVAWWEEYGVGSPADAAQHAASAEFQPLTKPATYVQFALILAGASYYVVEFEGWR